MNFRPCEGCGQSIAADPIRSEVNGVPMMVTTYYCARCDKGGIEEVPIEE